MGNSAATPHNTYADGWLTPAARQLCADAWKGLDPQKLVDIHAHVCGLGTNASGCYVNAKMNSTLWHPYHSVKRMAFLGAAGVSGSDANADHTYLNVLRTLIDTQTPPGSGAHGRAMLLPFDQYYSKAGVPDRALTGFHVPNEWVQAAAAKHPDSFLAAMSVHPYRPDALEQLERWHKAGSRVIKWLPNSMGIDPSDDKCIPYYRKCKELGLTILCHTGQEHSVDAGFLDNELGNPLHLRLPLEMGVRVIAAHCATEGDCCDTDPMAEDRAKTRAAAEAKDAKDGKAAPAAAAGASDAKAGAAAGAAAATGKGKAKRADNFDLFLRLMREKKYDGLLYGDISAITAHRRVQYLERLLDATDIHHRLIFGTDYPVPAVWVVVWTRRLVNYGLITAAERTALDALYRHNALLFDFVLKRTLRSPKLKNRFADCVFQTPDFLEPPPQQQPQPKVVATPAVAAAAAAAAGDAKKGDAKADDTAGDAVAAAAAGVAAAAAATAAGVLGGGSAF